jgi:AcrR family transcriptional regulator
MAMASIYRTMCASVAHHEKLYDSVRTTSDWIAACGDPLDQRQPSVGAADKKESDKSLSMRMLEVFPMATATPRKPQQARSIASRHRLLEATIACLIQQGYANTTTTAVVKRAGLSQGALFKHFPNKAALMGAATELLFARLIEGYRKAFADLADERIDALDKRVEAAVDLLWELFMDAPVQAAHELYVASRSDATLAAVLGPIVEQHHANIQAEAARLFPELGDRPGLEPIIRGLIASLQGVALVAHIGNHDAERDFIRRVALRECLGIAGHGHAGEPSA